MIFDQSQENIQKWKSQMQLYEKGKRTKLPFGKTVPVVEHVTYQHVKAKQCSFNPILQTHQRQQDQREHNRTVEQRRAKSLLKHLKQTLKYQKSFDIVNLQSNQSYEDKTPAKKLGPIRNAFDVINNQRLPEYFFKNREVKLPIEREKKLLQNNKKQFNIITNTYKQNHQQRFNEELQKQNKQLAEKYWKTHHYDPVYGKLYNSKSQDEYQKERKAKQLEHGRDADSKLPPSYIYRQPLIVDYTKPLPESLKILDERNSNAKKRFQAKYVVLDEYQKRNAQEQAKHEVVLKNHVHFGRILDEKAREFDIVTNKAYSPTRAEQLFGKKPTIESWDVLIKQAAKNSKSAIKSGGFA